MMDISVDDSKINSVYTKLKELVVNYRFRPGERLHINELSDQLQVSMTPVREALIRLHGETLVDAVPNRGFFSKVPRIEELQAVYEMAWIILKHSILVNASKFEFLDTSQFDDLDVKPNGKIESDSREVGQAQVLVVEKLFEGIATLSENQEMIKAVRNFNDRSHYIRVIQFETGISGHRISNGVHDLVRALRERDSARAVLGLDRQFSQTLQAMPGLVKEGLTRAYLSQPAGHGDRRIQQFTWR